MLPLTLLAVAVAAIVLLVAGLLGPVVPVVLLVLALVPLFVMTAARLFRHAPGGSAPRRGPAMPSTTAASYEPVEDPGARR